MAKSFVYRNLHEKCWSVLHKGIVVAHSPRVFLWDGEFQVSQKGNERVRKERRKNVHAYVKCDLDNLWVSSDAKIIGDIDLFKFDLLKKLGETNTKQITYQPYKMRTFQEVESRKPIFKASHIYLTGRGSVYVPPDPTKRQNKKRKVVTHER